MVVSAWPHLSTCYWLLVVFTDSFLLYLFTIFAEFFAVCSVQNPPPKGIWWLPASIIHFVTPQIQYLIFSQTARTLCYQFRNMRSLLYMYVSIIALVIIEICPLWLVEVWFIFSRNAKFQNGCLVFCQCYWGSDEHGNKNLIPKNTKDAIKFGVTLFKRKMN